MNAKFLKFITGSLIVRIIKAVSAGASALLLVAGALITLRRFELIGLSFALIWVIGALAFVVVGGGVYLLLHRSVMRLATDLDMRYGLQDRVHTMLEFRESEGAIYSLQRDDAEKRLGEISPKPTGLKTLAVFLAVTVLCASLFAVSFVFKPAEEPPEEIQTTPFELSEMDELALVELIEYVSTSNMESPHRENIALTLTELLESARVCTTWEEFNILFDEAVYEMLAETDSSSFALEMIEALWVSDNEELGWLAKAINYYPWASDGGWDTFDEGMKAFREQFIHKETAQQNPNEALMVQDTKQLLNGSGSVLPVMLKSTGVGDSDPLYLALASISGANPLIDGGNVQGFLALATSIETIGYTSTQNKLDALITAAKLDIFDAIEINRTNTSTGEYAINRVCQIFGKQAPKFERPDLFEKSEVSGGGDDETGGGGGGIGGVGTEFGSDDLVLDPDTDRYVKYGEIVYKYQAIMNGKVNAGQYTEDEILALVKYYEILFKGFEENDGN